MSFRLDLPHQLTQMMVLLVLTVPVAVSSNRRENEQTNAVRVTTIPKARYEASSSGSVTLAESTFTLNTFRALLLIIYSFARERARARDGFRSFERKGKTKSGSGARFKFTREEESATCIHKETVSSFNLLLFLFNIILCL